MSSNPAGTCESGAACSSGIAWAGLALVVAAVTTAGSLVLSLVLELKACPLCFYQRTFAVSALATLGLGLIVEPRRPRLLCLLALPLATGGLGVAGFHEYLVVSETLECPPGLFGLGTAPLQSLAAFASLWIVLAAGVCLASDAGAKRCSFSGPLAVVLGGLAAWGSIASSPPLPNAPDKPHETPLDTCRRPYHADQ
jgi:disulfide bond formation protein DsbB